LAEKKKAIGRTREGECSTKEGGPPLGFRSYADMGAKKKKAPSSNEKGISGKMSPPEKTWWYNKEKQSTSRETIVPDLTGKKEWHTLRGERGRPRPVERGHGTKRKKTSRSKPNLPPPVPAEKKNPNRFFGFLRKKKFRKLEINDSVKSPNQRWGVLIDTPIKRKGCVGREKGRDSSTKKKGKT